MPSLGTAGNYSVLAASTITNTGPSLIGRDLGLWPGTSITGFPPGVALGDIDVGGLAQQAQSDLTAAYVNALSRPITDIVPADLAGLHLGPGVYAASGHGALLLSGTLVLDGDGLFIIQTDSTITTATASAVILVGGARACNVFWQVGSSATLGTFSVFTGSILANTSITVTTGVAIDGRALARNAAVTLDSDAFAALSCA